MTDTTDTTDAGESPDSHYDRVGGRPAIREVVERFYVRVLDDAELAPYFTDADMAQVKRHQVLLLSQVLGGEIDGLLSDTDIALPKLDEGTAIEIIAANVRAIAMVYFSAMLEELKYYAVADKVAEHFMIGMLPISRGPAGDKIYAWLREGPPNRFSEVERRSIYGRTLGLAQGAAIALFLLPVLVAVAIIMLRMARRAETV